MESGERRAAGIRSANSQFDGASDTASSRSDTASDTATSRSDAASDTATLERQNRSVKKFNVRAHP